PLITSSIWPRPATVTLTRVPVPLRFDRVPEHWTINERFRAPPSLRSSEGGASRLFTTISRFPSLSRSPIAQPLETRSAVIPGPDLADTSSKRPSRRLRYSTLGCLYEI